MESYHCGYAWMNGIRQIRIASLDKGLWSSELSVWNPSLTQPLSFALLSIHSRHQKPSSDIFPLSSFCSLIHSSLFPLLSAQLSQFSLFSFNQPPALSPSLLVPFLPISFKPKDPSFLRCSLFVASPSLSRSSVAFVSLQFPYSAAAPSLLLLKTLGSPFFFQPVTFLCFLYSQLQDPCFPWFFSAVSAANLPLETFLPKPRHSLSFIFPAVLRPF